MNYRLMSFVCFAIILLSASYVSGLGVTPARTTLDFSEGLTETVQFEIINSDEADLSLFLFARGDLNESISFKEQYITMSAGETRRVASYEVTLPSSLTPGLHATEVIVLQIPEGSKSGEAALGTALGVATQLHVYVPYPGKYVDAELHVQGPEGQKQFVIPVINRGKEGISSVHAEIAIFDADGERVSELSTNSVSLDSQERAELTARIENVPEGTYTARAAIRYDGEERLLEEQFELGELVLDLKQIFVDNFELGGIAKFTMVVENKWNEPLAGAYAEMRVFDESFNELASTKSATYDIPQGTQTTMEYFWDTADVVADTYSANVILYYGNKKTQQDLQLVVEQDRIDVIGVGYVISSGDSGSASDSNLVIILGTVIGILVIMNLLWFLILRKSLHRGKKRK